ncbi:hypothetical protein EMPS_03642 [Entomortierella parvispora]|uniref:Fe2OG dioxygenase domain-containing protein n=1 Tax=Entomortierella parvispora TaxID=205924 RepID=A0A9P3H755_9FUNG|nr:hypothetical protein EMPS_03642 [Entomortierella parvispora]
MEMEELNQELFGSSDSDSESVIDLITHSYPRETSHEQPRMPASDRQDDPIFHSIMDSSFERGDTDDQQQDHRRPVHSSHPHIPGLVLHTHVLTHLDQSRLMEQITEHNFFKGGQQNQAMCFGPKELIWIQELESRLWETGVLDEPYCASSWTARMPLFDQSIMNLYQPGEGIKPHVDLARFDDGIVIVSLVSGINMDFYPALKPMSPNDPPQGDDRSKSGNTSSIDNSSASSGMMSRVSACNTTLKTSPCIAPEPHSQRPAFSVRLEPGSVVTMQGAARYEWEHGIQEVTEDETSPGEYVKRQIRVSITLRKMRQQAWEVGGLNSHPGALKNGVADRT